MFPKPIVDLKPNTYAFEVNPLIKPTGFREYDARWWYGVPSSDKLPELNLMGVTALGMGIGTYLGETGVAREVVTGHDYRAYSGAIKTALITGLMASGCRVYDIGLAMTPMAYFAQFNLDVPAVAMVTASHNENGWTGVKMGSRRPITFGPDEIGRLKDIVLNSAFDLKGGGSYVFVENFAERYIADLTARPKFTPEAQGGGGLRQRHRRRVRAEGAGAARRRDHPARHDARLQFPALQPEPRRHGDAPRHRPRGEGAQGRHRPRLRRRRRPLRRDRQRRARRSSPTRSASCSPATSPPSTRARPSSST